MGSENSVNNYTTTEIDEASHSADDDSAADPKIYFRDLSLAYFVANPLSMLDEHGPFKEMCLKNDKPEAHYIEGILQYFVRKDKANGLYHLRRSAILNNKNGMYLYGVLMLALGYYLKGFKYFDKLEWKSNEPIT